MKMDARQRYDEGRLCWSTNTYSNVQVNGILSFLLHTTYTNNLLHKFNKETHLWFNAEDLAIAQSAKSKDKVVIASIQPEVDKVVP